FLSVSHSIVFDRFFSGNLFSRSFFASALVISITSFSVVVALQLYFYPTALAGVRFDFLQISLIFSFIAFNVLFDYFTIVQTKIFIEASISAKSIFRSILFIASDLMVTMNTFILAYAFFILLVVQYFVWPQVHLSYVREHNAESNATALREPPNYLTEIGTPEALDRLRFSDNFSGALVDDGAAGDPIAVEVYYDTTLDPRAVDLQTLLLSNISRLQVTQTVDFKEYSGDGEEDLARFIGVLTRVARWVRFAAELEGDQLPAIEATPLVVSGNISGLGGLDAAYTMTFNQTDALEDGFPASIFGSLEVVELRRFVADTISNERLPAPMAICIFDDGSMTRFNITNESIASLNDCPNFITTEFLWRRSLSMNFSTAGRDLDNRIVPYNTLLITSLLPTLLFYIVILLMAFATFIFSYIIKSTQRLKTYFLRAPLTITCFILAVPLAAFGVL
ncbi:MAG: hypothetical protein KDE11_15445, partial [Rhodobacteraceae bacterium]|nr:hypothetical protein [Paracoccaceae bacterium]